MGVSLSPHQQNKRKRQDPTPDINITPLVDVVLVLLIIFMVVTPSLQDGEHVELPQILEIDKRKDNNPIEVTISVDLDVVVEDRRMKMDELEAALKQLNEADPERRVLLKIDVRVPYKTVRDVFGKVQNLGFRGVALKVRPEKSAAEDDPFGGTGEQT